MTENRIRVYELAKELSVDSKKVLDVLKSLGVAAKNHMAGVSDDVADKVRKTIKATSQGTSQAKPSKESDTLKATPIRAGVGEVRPTSRQVGAGTTGPQRGGSGTMVDARRDSAAATGARTASPAAGGRTAAAPTPGARATRSQTPGTRTASPGASGASTASARTSVSASVRPPARSQREESVNGTRGKADVRGPRRVTIQGDMPVRELSSLVGAPVPVVLRVLMSMGRLININQNVPADLAAAVAEKLGCSVTVKEPEIPVEQMILQELEEPDDPAKSVPRPPVVTVMGHVDHGKTSLLDAIRHTNVTAHEAGGITQHIGASVVDHEGKKIIFLDTPGHEAFTAMRARGAQVTDIAVLVVAADDGVMPQTIEAANHAKAAKVPIVVAINKIDKPGAKVERVMKQLSEIGLVPEEWGGDVVCVPVSAKTGQGLKDLLEIIVLVAEMQELKADPTRRARGTIIESRMDKGLGPVGTALVRSGVLKTGDVIITDTTWGRIRAMFDGRGRQVKKAGPSTPVEIVGLEGLPQAGDRFLVIDDERLAKEISEKRKMEKRAQELTQVHHMTLEDLEAQEKEKTPELRLIVKADVQGSLEAILQALRSPYEGPAKLEVVHSGVGAIIESDVMLAKASNARVLGFNVRPDANARKVAEEENVEIRTYRVIYDLLDDVEAMRKGLLKPRLEEVVVGHAEVRATFHVPKIGTVAGCYVNDGKVARNYGARLLRDGAVVYEGKIASLRRFKDDVSEVAAGYECGIGLERFQDVKPGDVIEIYTLKKVLPE
ncbi:MAG TPA: translation initiation factor IF-2 [Firmicutes bacterium]|nr:translation initiation factor IF-2 [Candidatus Fermentithermobacillaceae bacterium]